VELKLELDELTSRIEEMEAVIQQTAKENDACQRLTTIPGSRTVTATALIAVVSNGMAFRKGRNLAALMNSEPNWIGD
jgi:transposase